MNKLMYIVGGIIVFLVVLILTGRKSVHNEITINASREQVWEVLTNIDNYPSWNPVMKVLEGEILEGTKIRYQFTQDENNISEIEATVLKVIPNTLLNQGGGIPMVLTYDHKYALEPIGNSTKVTIHEDYKGLGVNFWNPKPVEEAYKRLNIALKNATEELIDD